jgi:hypothetical protein
MQMSFSHKCFWEEVSVPANHGDFSSKAKVSNLEDKILAFH